MQHVIVFLSWKADWQREQGQRQTDIPNPLAEGLQAYANKQSHVYQSVPYLKVCQHVVQNSQIK